MRWKDRVIWLRLELLVGVVAVAILIAADWLRQ
jgi:hypothetical protein